MLSEYAACGGMEISGNGRLRELDEVDAGGKTMESSAAGFGSEAPEGVVLAVESEAARLSEELIGVVMDASYMESSAIMLSESCIPIAEEYGTWASQADDVVMSEGKGTELSGESDAVVIVLFFVLLSY